MSRWFNSLRSALSTRRVSLTLSRDSVAAYCAGRTLQRQFDSPLFSPQGDWIGTDALRGWVETDLDGIPPGTPVSVRLPAPAVKHSVAPVQSKPRSRSDLQEIARWQLERVFADVDGLRIRAAYIRGAVVAAAVEESLLASLKEVLEPKLRIIEAGSRLTGMVLEGTPAPGGFSLRLDVMPDSWWCLLRDPAGAPVSLRSRWRQQGDSEEIAQDIARTIRSIGHTDRVALAGGETLSLEGSEILGLMQSRYGIIVSPSAKGAPAKVSGSINFFDRRLERQRFWTASVAGSVAAIVAAAAVTGLGAHRKHQEVERLAGELEQIERQLSEAAAGSESDVRQETVEIIRTIDPGAGIHVLSILNHLEEVFPREVRLSRLEYDRNSGRLALEVHAPERTHMAGLVDALALRFSQVRITREEALRDGVLFRVAIDSGETTP